MRSTWFATHWSRSSGVVSTRTRVRPSPAVSPPAESVAIPLGYEITTDGRVRLSRASLLLHTGQWQPIIGMPALVPVPRKRSSIGPSDTPEGYSLRRDKENRSLWSPLPLGEG